MKYSLKAFNSLLRQNDNNQLLKNVIGNYLVKAAALLVSLLLTPAYMSYFSDQSLLGMWFTASSILNWILLFDFGIGGGMRNQLVKPLMQRDKNDICEILSAGYISVGTIIVLLLFLQVYIVEWIDWHSVFNITESEISSSTLKVTVHILVAGVCVRFVTVLINHVFYAMQKATIPSVLTLIPNILILLYIWIANPTGTESDIIKLAMVQALATNVPALIATAILFLGKLRGALPRFSALRWNRVKSIMGTGTGLFYLQILITLVFGVKEIFISWFVGADQVVDYNVYLKLIGVVSTLFSLALTPVWSSVTKDYALKKYQRIRKLYVVGMGAMGVFGACQLLLIVAMPWVAKIWLGENTIGISRGYALIYGAYNLIYMWTMLNYNFACGMGRVKTISFYLSLAVLLNILLAYWWCSIEKTWILVIAATAVATIPCAVFVPRSILKFPKNE